MLRLIFVSLFCPPLCLVVLATMTLYLFSPTALAWAELWRSGYKIAIEGVASSINSWYFHDCWLFPVACVGVWPLWMMAWVLVASYRESGSPLPKTPSKPHLD